MYGQTDATEHPTHAIGCAGVGNKNVKLHQNTKYKMQCTQVLKMNGVVCSVVHSSSLKIFLIVFFLSEREVLNFRE